MAGIKIKEHFTNVQYIKHNLGNKAFIKASFKGAINQYHQFLHKDIHMEDTIIISGSPRGGTTWFMEILGTLPHYKLIFEPLHENWYPWVRKYNIPLRPYIPPEKKDDTLYEYLSYIFSGKLPGYDFPLLLPTINLFSINYLKTLSKELSANKILVKSINANRLLPWIATNFNLKGIFYIIRHPCATIESQIRTGAIGYPKYIEDRVKEGDMKILKNLLISDLKDIELFDEKTIKKIARFSKKEEILAAIWALDNYIPLTYIKNKPEKAIRMVAYEQLIYDFEDTISNILKHLHYNIPPDLYKKYKAPSKTTNDYKYVGTLKQVSKWKDKMTPEKIKNILDVVDLFNIDMYSDKCLPNL